MPDLESLCLILISAGGFKFDFEEFIESFFPLSNEQSFLPARKAGE